MIYNNQNSKLLSELSYPPALCHPCCREAVSNDEGVWWSTFPFPDSFLRSPGWSRDRRGGKVTGEICLGGTHLAPSLFTWGPSWTHGIPSNPEWSLMGSILHRSWSVFPGQALLPHPHPWASRCAPSLVLSLSFLHASKWLCWTSSEKIPCLVHKYIFTEPNKVPVTIQPLNSVLTTRCVWHYARL